MHYSLDKFLTYLDKAPTINSSKARCCSVLIERICKIARNILLFFSKLWNYCCGDKNWYGKKQAILVLNSYLNGKDNLLFANVDKLRQIDKRIGSPQEINFEAIVQAKLLSNAPPPPAIVIDEGVPEESPIRSPRTMSPSNRPYSPKPIKGTAIEPLPLAPSSLPPDVVPEEPKVLVKIKKKDSSAITQLCWSEIPQDKPRMPKVDFLPALPASTPFTRTALAESFLFDAASLDHDMGIDDRLVFLLNANQFGQNAHLDKGSTHLKPLKYVQQYLARSSDVRHKQIAEELIQPLSFAELFATSSADTERFIAEFNHQIEQGIKLKRDVLVPTGWIDHAVWMKISFSEDGKNANIRHYNLGAGAPNHFGGVAENRKVKAPAYEEWHQIPIENLRNPNYVIALFKVNTEKNHPLDKKPTEYGAADLYQGMKLLLKPTKTTYSTLLMSTQNAGVCTMRSLLAFLCSRLEEGRGVEGVHDYKRLISGMKTHSLCVRIKKSIHLPEIPDLISKSFIKLCRNVTKLWSRGIVGDAYIKSVRPHLEGVHSFLANKAAVAHLQFTVASKEPIKPEKRIWHSTVPPISSIERAIVTDEKVAKSLSDVRFIDQTMKLLADLSVETADATLLAKLGEVVVEARKSLASGDYLQLYTGLFKAITACPLLLFSKKKISFELTTEFVSIYKELGHLFFKSSFMIPQSHHIFSNTVYGLWRCHAIQNLLLQSIFKTELTVYCEGINLKHLFLNSISPQFIDEYRTTIRRNGESDLQNFYLPTMAFREKSLTLVTTICEMDISCIKDWEKRISEFQPNLTAQLNEKYPEAVSAPQYGREAYLYASPELWPTWLQDASTIYLDLSYILKAPFGKLRKIIPGQTLEWNSAKISVYNHLGKDQYTVTHSAKDLNDLNLDSSNQKTHVGIELIDSRFISMNGSFASESLEKLMLYLVKNKDIKERSLITDRTTCKEIGISLEECQEIAHFFTADTNSLANCIEPISAFTKKPQKLTERSGQQSFRFFYSNLRWITPYVNHPALAEKMHHFVKSHYQLFREQNQLSGAIFLLEQSIFFETLFPSRFVKGEAISALQELIKELEKIEITSERVQLHLGLAYTLLVANYGLKTTLSSKELESLIIAKAYLSKYPVDADWVYPERELQCRQTYEIHETILLDYISNEAAPYMNQINSIFQLPKDTVWTVVSSERRHLTTIVEGASYQFYPLEGVLRSTALRLEKLPIEILQHSEFAGLFPKVERGLYRGPNHYRFELGGKQIEIALKKGVIQIEQSWNSLTGQTELMIYTPLRAYAKDGFSNKELLRNYYHWFIKEDATSALFHLTDRSGQLRMIAEIPKGDSRGNGKVIRVSDQSMLMRWRGPWERLDLTDQILIWGKESDADRDNNLCHVVEIDVTRLNQKFLFKPEVPLPTGILPYESVQMPGFFITNKNLPFFNKFLNYVVLEDVKGNQRVLLSNLKFLPVESPKVADVLTGTYEIEWQLSMNSNDPIETFCFSVDSLGRVRGKNRTENLHLALRLTVGQNYQAAAELLRTYGGQPIPFTPAEREILSDLAKLSAVTGNTDANAAALHTYAGYLLLRENTSQPSEQTAKLLNATINQYAIYLDKYRNATDLTLYIHEETFLLRRALSNEFNPVFYLRLRELSPVQAARFELVEKETEDEMQRGRKASEMMKLLTTLASNIESYLKGTVEKMAIEFSPRIEVYIKKDFFTFYACAIGEDCLDKQRLNDSLYFLEFSPKDESRIIAALFRCFMNERTVFPQLPKKGSTAGQLDAWKDEVYSAINRFNPSFPNPKSRAMIPMNNKTPRDFQLEPAPLTLSEADRKVATEWTAPTVMLPSLSLLADRLVNKSPLTPVPFRAMERLLRPLKAIPALATNPLYETELKKIHEDEAFLLAQPKPVEVIPTIPLELLATMKLHLASNTATLKEIGELKSLILHMVNKIEEEADIVQYKHWGQKHKGWTIEQVLMNFARQDLDALYRQNQSLSVMGIRALYNAVTHYLILQTREQQLDRARTVLNNYENAIKNNKPKEAAAHVKKLYEELNATRLYSPKTNPSFLVLEHFANINLRKVQIETVQLFIKTKNFSLLKELMMGAGKSTVLVPFFLLLASDRKKIPILIAPASLLSSIGSTASQTLLGAFGQPILPLLFERSTPLTIETIQGFLDDIEAMQKEAGCIIMTSSTPMSLMLKYLEALDQHNKGKEQTELLALMRELLNKLLADGLPLIDEADSVLNVLRNILCFSIGTATAPNPNDVQLIADLYKLLYSNERLKKIAKLESDPNPIVDAPPLSEEIYEKELQPAIAALFADYLRNSGKLEGLLEGDLLMAYLVRDPNQLEASQVFFNKQSKELKNILALSGQMISAFLKHTLLRETNQHFGIDKESILAPVAVPFVAAKTPSKNSLFSNIDILISLTIQIYVHDGIDASEIEKTWKRLQSEALRESSSKSHEAEFTIEKTNQYQVFKKLCGKLTQIRFLDFNVAHLNLLVEEVNSSIEKKIHYVQEVVMPQLGIAPTQLSFNPQQLVSLFSPGQLIAVTGTAGWFSPTVHSSIKSVLEMGNTAKTAGLLLTKDPQVHVIKEGSLELMLKEIKANFGAIDLIIDAGSTFKRYECPEIAGKMAVEFGKPTIWYDPKGAQHITPGGDLNMECSNRLVILDPLHTIGADNSYSPTALGVVTVGSDLMLCKLEQAIWRLRQFSNEQQVGFVVTDRIAFIIRQTLQLSKTEKITLEHIYSFAFLNQINQQAVQNPKAFLQQLDAIPTIILLKLLLSPNLTQYGRKYALDEFRSLWFKSAELTARKRYGVIPKLHPSKDFITLFTSQTNEILDQLFSKMPFLYNFGVDLEEEKDKVALIGKNFENLFPEKIFLPMHQESDSTEVEASQHQNVEVHVAKAQEEPTVRPQLTEFFTPPRFVANDFDRDMLKSPIASSFSLRSYLPYDQDLKGFETIFSPHLFATTNMIECVKGEEKISPLRLLGIYRVPMLYVQLSESGVTLLAKADTSVCSAISLYDLQLGAIHHVKTEIAPLEAKYRLELIQAQFLKGKTDYSKDSQPILKEWLASAGWKKMFDLFTQVILPHNPSDLPGFSSSTLGAIFAELSQESVPKSLTESR